MEQKNEKYFIRLYVTKEDILNKLDKPNEYSDVKFDIDTINIDAEGNLEFTCELIK